MNDAQRLSPVFAALSDPIRRNMLTRLAQSSCSVSELGAPFPITPPAVTKHLDVLERSGLIARWKSGRTHYCRLLPVPLQAAMDWIEQQRGFWEQQFTQLDDFLHGEDGTWTTPSVNPPPSPTPPVPPSGSAATSPSPRKGSSPPGRARKR